MNITILAYGIYFLITVLIILYVGHLFHKNGMVFLESIFKDRENKTAKALNNLLLIAYYLVNIGYALYQIVTWNSINNVIQMIEILSYQIGMIIMILSALHYFNLFWINLLFKKQTINL